VNGFGEPLFNRIVFMLCPKLFHLLCGPLRNQSLILNLLPERGFVQVLSIVRAHNLKEFNAFNNCKLFLLADIKLFATNVVALRQFVVIFFLNHLGTSNLHRIIFVAFNGVSNPVANVYRTLIKIFHF
jgi:hypothetical protein